MTKAKAKFLFQTINIQNCLHCRQRISFIYLISFKPRVLFFFIDLYLLYLQGFVHGTYSTNARWTHQPLGPKRCHLAQQVQNMLFSLSKYSFLIFFEFKNILMSATNYFFMFIKWSCGIIIIIFIFFCLHWQFKVVETYSITQWISPLIYKKYITDKWLPDYHTLITTTSVNEDQVETHNNQCLTAKATLQQKLFIVKFPSPSQSHSLKHFFYFWNNVHLFSHLFLEWSFFVMALIIIQSLLNLYLSVVSSIITCTNS